MFISNKMIPGVITYQKEGTEVLTSFHASVPFGEKTMKTVIFIKEIRVKGFEMFEFKTYYTDIQYVSIDKAFNIKEKLHLVAEGRAWSAKGAEAEGFRLAKDKNKDVIVIKKDLIKDQLRHYAMEDEIYNIGV